MAAQQGLAQRVAPLADTAAADDARGAPTVTSELQSAIRTIGIEATGLTGLAEALQGPLAEPFSAAVQLLRAARGRVIVSGIGKSGHIGQKLAATFASTGTPAFFIHPSEASHGDLGMITPDDAIVGISWSGETVELANILTFSRRYAVPLISITSRRDSALGRASDVVLELPRVDEACPHGLAPTTSTTMQLALGDALAIALLEAGVPVTRVAADVGYSTPSAFGAAFRQALGSSPSRFLADRTGTPTR